MLFCVFCIELSLAYCPGADPGMARFGPAPLFLQLNHAKFSLFWGYILVNFPPILTLGPLFLQILDPALLLSYTVQGLQMTVNFPLV